MWLVCSLFTNRHQAELARVQSELEEISQATRSLVDILTKKENAHVGTEPRPDRKALRGVDSDLAWLGGPFWRDVWASVFNWIIVGYIGAAIAGVVTAAARGGRADPVDWSDGMGFLLVWILFGAVGLHLCWTLYQAAHRGCFTLRPRVAWFLVTGITGGIGIYPILLEALQYRVVFVPAALLVVLASCLVTMPMVKSETGWAALNKRQFAVWIILNLVIDFVAVGAGGIFVAAIFRRAHLL